MDMKLSYSLIKIPPISTLPATPRLVLQDMLATLRNTRRFLRHKPGVFSEDVDVATDAKPRLCDAIDHCVLTLHPSNNGYWMSIVVFLQTIIHFRLDGYVTYSEWLMHTIETDSPNGFIDPTDDQFMKIASMGRALWLQNLIDEFETLVEQAAK